MIPNIIDEIALATKIISLHVACEFPAGLTTHEQRREIVQKSLAGIEDVTFTIRDGKRVTIREQFVRVYGE